jgi:peptidase E
MAQAIFRSLGIEHLECVDIDAEPNIAHLRLSERYDVVYLTGGDPLLFRRNIRRSGLADQLRAFRASGRIIVGASGGAMQLTQNVSLFRLQSGSVDDVITAHDEFDGLGFVDAEILPHLDKHDAAFLEKVTKYSERIPHDVIAVADGGAVICDDEGPLRVFGEAQRFRKGVRSPIRPSGLP